MSLNYCNTSFYGLWGFFFLHIVFGYLLNLKIFLLFGFYSSFFDKQLNIGYYQYYYLKKYKICNPQVIIKKSVFSVTPNFSGHKTAVVNFDFVCNLVDQSNVNFKFTTLVWYTTTDSFVTLIALSIKKKRKKI